MNKVLYASMAVTTAVYARRDLQRISQDDEITLLEQSVLNDDEADDYGDEYGEEEIRTEEDTDSELDNSLPVKAGTIEDDYTDDLTDDDPLIDPDEDIEDTAEIDRVNSNVGVKEAAKQLLKGIKPKIKKPKQGRMTLHQARRKLRNKVIDKIKIIRAGFAASQQATIKNLQTLKSDTNRLHREAYYKIQGAFFETNSFITKVKRNYHNHIHKNKSKVTPRRKIALLNWVNGRIKFSK